MSSQKGGAGRSQAQKDALRIYQSSLEGLTYNSQRRIHWLTILAGANMAFAESVVSMIEAQIAKAPSSEKLPVTYLMDSIVKNVGREYVPAFGTNLVGTFLCVFEKADKNTRKHLFRLRSTWDGIFPLEKLDTLDIRVNSLDPAWPIKHLSLNEKSSDIHVNSQFCKKSAATLTKSPHQTQQENWPAATGILSLQAPKELHESSMNANLQIPKELTSARKRELLQKANRKDRCNDWESPTESERALIKKLLLLDAESTSCEPKKKRRRSQVQHSLSRPDMSDPGDTLDYHPPSSVLSGTEQKPAKAKHGVEFDRKGPVGDRPRSLVGAGESQFDGLLAGVRAAAASRFDGPPGPLAGSLRFEGSNDRMRFQRPDVFDALPGPDCNGPAGPGARNFPLRADGHYFDGTSLQGPQYGNLNDMPMGSHQIPLGSAQPGLHGQGQQYLPNSGSFIRPRAGDEFEETANPEESAKSKFFEKAHEELILKRQEALKEEFPSVTAGAAGAAETSSSDGTPEPSDTETEPDEFNPMSSTQWVQMN